jgi:serine phosphatase RsbU (regulator of sigma subunit)
MEDKKDIKEEDKEPVKTDAEKRAEEYEALKAENDKVQEELLRREKLKAEIALAGTAGGRVEPKPAPPETDKEYTERIKKEIAEGKYNG